MMAFELQFMAATPLQMAIKPRLKATGPQRRLDRLPIGRAD
jgi:hypothetical protein